MEETVDFDEWIKTFVPAEPEYYAIYDKDSGAVIGIYPEHSSKNFENRLKVDRELAESIFNGKLNMSSCFVDFNSDTLEIVQVHSLRKIDDILHRVIDKAYSDVSKSDIIVSHIVKDKKLRFELTDFFTRRKIRWSGDTELRFIICSYNDPHKIYQVINLTLDELSSGSKECKLETEDKKFSVFTTRVLKTYTLERI